MNRKIAKVILIVFVLAFVSFVVVSSLMTKDPLKQEFGGIISDYSRMYPSKIKFNFKGIRETFYMVNDREEFIKSISIGDSILKPQNDPYIYVYKKNNDTYILSRKFIYE